MKSKRHTERKRRRVGVAGAPKGERAGLNFPSASDTQPVPAGSVELVSPNNALVAVGLTLDAVLERVSCYEEEANASRFGFREDAQ